MNLILPVGLVWLETLQFLPIISRIRITLKVILRQNNLYTNGTGYFDAGGNIYSTNKVGKITLTKTVIDGEDGTFYFKAVNNSGQTIGKYVITTNGGRVTSNPDATTGDLSTALNSGSIVIYETASTYIQARINLEILHVLFVGIFGG